jgi:hypothetical protein
MLCRLGIYEFSAASDVPTEEVSGSMEILKMGVFAWGLPHKTAVDLGLNGWDKFAGYTFNLAST